jgi:hypothetical protein
LYDLDGGVGINSNPNPPDSIWLYDALIHPSAATHRIYGYTLSQLLLGFVQPSVQILKFADAWNLETNSNPIAWVSGIPLFGIPQTPSPSPLPPAASCQDPRLLLAQTISLPQLRQAAGTDYDNGLVLPDASWVGWTNGGGVGGVVSFAYALGAYGAVEGLLTAVNDGYGQIRSGTPLITPGLLLGKGPLSFVFRIGRIATSGDQITIRGGLVDALILGRPQNGIFLEVVDNAGVFTCRLILANGGTFTTLSVPFTSTITNNAFQTFWFASDLAMRWWSVYASGVLCAVGKLPALPSGVALSLGWQGIKIAETTVGSSVAMCDGIWTLNYSGVRA